MALNKRALVLMYHRVLHDHEVSRDIDPGMYVTRESLDRHLRHLASTFELVSLDGIRDWIAGDIRFRKVPCAITFDDGWEDNYRNAFDLLSSHRVPATIFLVTDRVGTPGMMTWSQIQEMEHGGIMFGSHTATHALLPSLTESEVRQELERSQRTLQDRLERPSTWFCYPKGKHDAASRGITRERYSGAVAVRKGAISRGDDLYSVNRIGVHEDVSYDLPLFRCRLASIF